MRLCSQIFALLLSGALSLFFPPAFAARADSPRPTCAQKIQIRGVNNAGKVTDHLYRGSQPRLNDLNELKKLGVTTIIDLRRESPHTAEEERLRAHSLGIKFLRIPIAGFSNPTNSELTRFFQVLRDAPSEIIFVHCEFGQDRTGVMIAAYRIAFENWSSEQALSEMADFGFNRLWHHSMITFVRNLPGRIESDPELKKVAKPD